MNWHIIKSLNCCLNSLNLQLRNKLPLPILVVTSLIVVSSCSSGGSSGQAPITTNSGTTTLGTLGDGAKIDFSTASLAVVAGGPATTAIVGVRDAKRGTKYHIKFSLATASNSKVAAKEAVVPLQIITSPLDCIIDANAGFANNTCTVTVTPTAAANPGQLVAITPQVTLIPPTQDFVAAPAVSSNLPPISAKILQALNPQVYIGKFSVLFNRTPPISLTNSIGATITLDAERLSQTPQEIKISTDNPSVIAVSPASCIINMFLTPIQPCQVMLSGLSVGKTTITVQGANQGNFIIHPYSFTLNVVNEHKSSTIVAGKLAASGVAVDGPATATNLSAPYGVSIGRDNIYLSDKDTNLLISIDQQGTLTKLRPFTSSLWDNVEYTYFPLLINTPLGIASAKNNPLINNSEMLAVSNSGSNQVYTREAQNPFQIVSSTTIVSSDMLSTINLNSAAAVAFDSVGNLYIADSGNNRVLMINSLSPLGTIIAGGGTNLPSNGVSATSVVLNNPSGVAVDAAGNVYIADTGNNVVEMVNELGNLVIIAGTPGQSATPVSGPATMTSINTPLGLAIDNFSGNLYIADNASNQILKVNPGGQLSIFAQQLTPPAHNAYSLNGPSGIAVDDSSGDVYISDTGNHVLERVTVSDVAPPQGK